MSRIDIPKLKCDRCEFTTELEDKMLEFKQIHWHFDNGHKRHEDDLCKDCWADFNAFMANTVPVKARP